ncbi:MAG: N-acyl homoserine lactonase family protein [Sphingomonadaceae bacterium]|nr:N-acyl homoserine lactonase family protein [Sphingomonadaceae bacterium]
MLTAAAALAALSAQAPAPQAAPDVRIYRLDCGAATLPKNLFSDVHAYPDGSTVLLTSSCYLIRHGQDLLIWDTGFGRDTIGKPQGLRTPIEPQLAALGVQPGQVQTVGLSHSHGDHTGQANAFPQAKLVIGAREYDALFGENAFLGLASPRLANWADGRNVQKVSGDLDLYKDGSVIVLSLPGHTPGHLALQVRLKNAGYVLLSGDQYHSRENRVKHGVPGFNYDRAQTLASSARLEELVRNLNARLIIQHDPQDNADAFPADSSYLN